MLKMKLPKPVNYSYAKVDASGITYSTKPFAEHELPKRYIINKNATILFWKDGTKTIVKRSKEDEYDKILGFLWAYFQKTSGLSKSKANDYLKRLKDCDDINNLTILDGNRLATKVILSEFNEALKKVASVLKNNNVGGK